MNKINAVAAKYFPEHTVIENIESPSLSHYVDFLTTTKPASGKPVMPDRYALSISPSNNDWAGGSMADAKRIITQGYEPKALKEVEVMNLEQIGAIEVNRDMMGCVPDVGAYLSGAPDCMMDFTLTAPKKFASLYISFSYSWQVESKLVEYYSAKIYGLYNTLLAQNYEVEIHAYSFATLGNKTNDSLIVHGFPLAQFGYKISPQLLAAVFHPTFLRRLRAPYMLMNHNSYAAGYTRPAPAGLQAEINQGGSVLLKSLNEIPELLDIKKYSRTQQRNAIDAAIDTAIAVIASNQD